MKEAKPNYVKQEMYALTCKRLQNALKSEFYYEAIMLDYALIEDRFEELLCLLGIANSYEEGLKVTSKAKKPLRALLKLNNTSRFGIKNINTKIEIVRRLITEDNFESEHFIFLHQLLINDKETLTELLTGVYTWKEKRNGLVHGLMDRVPYEVEPQLKEISEQGKKLFRTLDNLVGRMQKYEIRKKFKIQ